MSDSTGFGPYAVDYTLSGRHLVIAGRKGHISMMEWKNFQLTMELQVSFEMFRA